jgi:hypothetical protein
VKVTEYSPFATSLSTWKSPPLAVPLHESTHAEPVHLYMAPPRWVTPVTVTGSIAGQSCGTVTENTAAPLWARTRKGKARSRVPTLTSGCKFPATASLYATDQEASASLSQDCIF